MIGRKPGIFGGSAAQPPQIRPVHIVLPRSAQPLSQAAKEGADRLRTDKATRSSSVEAPAPSTEEQNPPTDIPSEPTPTSGVEPPDKIQSS